MSLPAHGAAKMNMAQSFTGMLQRSVDGPAVILPVDLPPQAFLTSAMLLDMVDSE